MRVNTLLAGKAYANLMSTMGQDSYAYDFSKDITRWRCQIICVWLPKDDSKVRKQILELPNVEHVFATECSIFLSAPHVATAGTESEDIPIADRD